jgi:general stress protein YciG
MSEEKPKSMRGFASMSPERRKEVCSAGGKAAHAKGKAHKFTTEEARLAGKIGGQKIKDKAEPDHFKKLGSLGGKARHKSRIDAKKPSE